MTFGKPNTYALALLLVFLSGAASIYAKRIPHDIRKRFSNRTDGHNNGIRSLINIDGYYQYFVLGHWISGYGKNAVAIDSSRMDFVFFENGYFLYNILYSNAGSLCDAFRQPSPPKNKAPLFGGYWGIYRIDGDTITGQFMDNPGYFGAFLAREVKFRIVDKHTLQYLSTQSLRIQTKQEKEVWNIAESSEKRTPIHFIPCTTMPSSDNWLMREKWLKCK